MAFDLSGAFNNARDNSVITIPNGEYVLNSALFMQGKKEITIRPEEPGRVLIRKGNAFQSEYLMYFYKCQEIVLEGLSLQGIFSTQKWGEQGIIFGSCHHVLVHNLALKNFGDAGIRANTNPRLSLPGVDSSHITIQECQFEDVYQNTTTQATSLTHGGTNNITFEKNLFIRSSIKLASRTPCGGAIVRKNKFVDSPDKGIDISSFSEVTIAENEIIGAAQAATSAYTNNVKGIKSYEWGTIDIQYNVIGNTPLAVRIANDPYADGRIYPMRGVHVQNNILYNIPTTSPIVLRGQMDNPIRENNKLFQGAPTLV